MAASSANWTYKSAAVIEIVVQDQWKARKPPENSAHAWWAGEDEPISHWQPPRQFADILLVSLGWYRRALIRQTRGEFYSNYYWYSTPGKHADAPLVSFKAIAELWLVKHRMLSGLWLAVCFTDITECLVIYTWDICLLIKCTFDLKSEWICVWYLVAVSASIHVDSRILHVN